MRTASTSEAGFTLVETLAAFAILALSLLALFAGVNGAVRGNTRADFEAAALRLARSQLETVGIATPLVPGTSSGLFDSGLEWTMTIEPYTGNPPTTGARGYWVEVSVQSPKAAGAKPLSLTLTTMKIAAVGQGSP